VVEVALIETARLAGFPWRTFPFPSTKVRYLSPGPQARGFFHLGGVTPHMTQCRPNQWIGGAKVQCGAPAGDRKLELA